MTMPDVFLIVALPCEARPLIDFFKLKKNEKVIRRLSIALNYLNGWEVIEVSPTNIPNVQATEYILKRKLN